MVLAAFFAVIDGDYIVRVGSSRGLHGLGSDWSGYYLLIPLADYGAICYLMCVALA